MFKCLWSEWKLQKGVKEVASPFTVLWMFVKENPDRKKRRYQNSYLINILPEIRKSGVNLKWIG